MENNSTSLDDIIKLLQENNAETKASRVEMENIGFRLTNMELMLEEILGNKKHNQGMPSRPPTNQMKDIFVQSQPQKECGPTSSIFGLRKATSIFGFSKQNDSEHGAEVPPLESNVLAANENDKDETVEPTTESRSNEEAISDALQSVAYVEPYPTCEQDEVMSPMTVGSPFVDTNDVAGSILEKHSERQTESEMIATSKSELAPSPAFGASLVAAEQTATPLSSSSIPPTGAVNLVGGSSISAMPSATQVPVESDRLVIDEEDEVMPSVAVAETTSDEPVVIANHTTTQANTTSSTLSAPTHGKRLPSEEEVDVIADTLRTVCWRGKINEATRTQFLLDVFVQLYLYTFEGDNSAMDWLNKTKGRSSWVTNEPAVNAMLDLMTLMQRRVPEFAAQPISVFRRSIHPTLSDCSRLQGYQYWRAVIVKKLSELNNTKPPQDASNLEPITIDDDDIEYETTFASVEEEMAYRNGRREFVMNAFLAGEISMASKVATSGAVSSNAPQTSVVNSSSAAKTSGPSSSTAPITSAACISPAASKIIKETEVVGSTSAQLATKTTTVESASTNQAEMETDEVFEDLEQKVAENIVETNGKVTKKSADVVLESPQEKVQVEEKPEEMLQQKQEDKSSMDVPVVKSTSTFTAECIEKLYKMTIAEMEQIIKESGIDRKRLSWHRTPKMVVFLHDIFFALYVRKFLANNTFDECERPLAWVYIYSTENGERLFEDDDEFDNAKQEQTKCEVRNLVKVVTTLPEFTTLQRHRPESFRSNLYAAVQAKLRRFRLWAKTEITKMDGMSGFTLRKAVPSSVVNSLITTVIKLPANHALNVDQPGAREGCLTSTEEAEKVLKSIGAPVEAEWEPSELKTTTYAVPSEAEFTIVLTKARIEKGAGNNMLRDTNNFICEIFYWMYVSTFGNSTEAVEWLLKKEVAANHFIGDEPLPEHYAPLRKMKRIFDMMKKRMFEFTGVPKANILDRMRAAVCFKLSTSAPPIEPAVMKPDDGTVDLTTLEEEAAAVKKSPGPRPSSAASGKQNVEVIVIGDENKQGRTRRTSVITLDEDEHLDVVPANTTAAAKPVASTPAVTSPIKVTAPLPPLHASYKAKKLSESDTTAADTSRSVGVRPQSHPEAVGASGAVGAVGSSGNSAEVKSDEDGADELDEEDEVLIVNEAEEPKAPTITPTLSSLANDSAKRMQNLFGVVVKSADKLPPTFPKKTSAAGKKPLVVPSISSLPFAPVTSKPIPTVGTQAPSLVVPQISALPLAAKPKLPSLLETLQPAPSAGPPTARPGIFGPGPAAIPISANPFGPAPAGCPPSLMSLPSQMAGCPPSLMPMTAQPTGCPPSLMSMPGPAGCPPSLMSMPGPAGCPPSLMSMPGPAGCPPSLMSLGSAPSPLLAPQPVPAMGPSIGGNPFGNNPLAFLMGQKRPGDQPDNSNAKMMRR